MASRQARNDGLTDKHLTMLNEVIRLSQRALELLGKCERCNLRVDKETALAKEQLETAMKLKREFFPESQ